MNLPDPKDITAYIDTRLGASRWPGDLGKPIDPLDNFLIAQAMSRKVAHGRVPEFEEARRYASEQCADGDANFREGFAMKYGAALGAD